LLETRQLITGRPSRPSFQFDFGDSSVGNAPWWLTTPARMQTFRNVFEAEPITFYQWTETDAGKPIEQPHPYQ
jgi:hypothetical protein